MTEGSEQHPENTTSTGLSHDEIKKIGNTARWFIRNHPPITAKDGWIEVESPYSPRALEVAREQLDPLVGMRFDAHGMERGNETEQLYLLHTILTQGVDSDRQLYSLPLRLTDEVEAGSASVAGAAGPYDLGAFILIGHPDQLIQDGGVAAVLVNEHFYDAIDALRQAYPSCRFIKASEMDTALQEMLTTKDTGSQ